MFRKEVKKFSLQNNNKNFVTNMLLFIVDEKFEIL